MFFSSALEPFKEHFGSEEKGWSEESYADMLAMQLVLPMDTCLRHSGIAYGISMWKNHSLFLPRETNNSLFW